MMCSNPRPQYWIRTKTNILGGHVITMPWHTMASFLGQLWLGISCTEV